MKTFKQYFTEATYPAHKDWDKQLKKNKMLATGVRLLKKIEKLGGEALIVGGSVRDILLGKDIKDIDIATNVPMNVIKQNFKWNDIGLSGKLGITMVHFGGYEFEVANYREESGTSDRRHPEMVKMVNSFETDSARRDITINSMGINSKGEIIDYQGGIDDLQRGIIRTVGSAKDRYMEDATRLLRTARFASKYGFKIDPDTKTAMKDLVKLIDDVKEEAIQKEFIKVSGTGESLAKYIEYLDDVGYLEKILPEIKALQGKKQNPKHHPEGDSYEHTLAALHHSRSNNPTVNLSILFHDLGKGTVEVGEKDGQPTYHGHDKESARLAVEIGKRLKFPNVVVNAMEFSAANHMKAHYIYDMSKKKITQLVSDPNWPILKDVVYADELSRGDVGKGGIDEFEKKMTFAETVANRVLKGREKTSTPQNIFKDKVDGNKVMKWTGLKSGRELGQILQAVQDWLYEQENIESITEDQVKEFVLNTYKAMIGQADSLEEQYEILLRCRDEKQKAVQRTLRRYSL